MGTPRRTRRHALSAPHPKHQSRRIKSTLHAARHLLPTRSTMSTATSGQFLTVPPLSHRSTHHHHHHRRDSARAAAQPPRMQHPATRNVASSSRVKMEDTPLGIPVSPSTPATPSADAAPARRASTTSTAARRRQTRPSPLAPPPSNTILLPATAANPSPSGARSQSQQSQQPQPQPQPQSSPVQLSPRSIFRAMPFLLRLRSPPSDLLNMTCTSGGPRTHSVLNRAQISKASQTVTYNETLVCEDAVNAEVLLRLARNELLERAQQTDRRVTALVDEE